MTASAATSAMPIFDGHNDVLLHLANDGKAGLSFLERRAEGHLDLVRAREGGFCGGFFACYTPSPVATEPVLARDGSHTTPLSQPPTPDQARAHTIRLAATLYRIERASAGALRVCRDVAQIESAVAAGAMAAVLHIEGAEAIGPELDELEVLHAAGLRSVGPVWSRANAFGTGVPFDNPGHPDIGPGLTDLGKELIRACNELGIMIDLSHLNEAGFWDVARLSDSPLIATHSNAHAISPVPRNLTDRQLDAVAESQGLVGINFAVSFLDPRGKRDVNLPLEIVVRHLDHLLSKLGPGGVALGSDFDGCTVPAALTDASGLPRLLALLREHGYDDQLLRRICFENWMGVLARTWQ